MMPFLSSSFNEYEKRQRSLVIADNDVRLFFKKFNCMQFIHVIKYESNLH